MNYIKILYFVFLRATASIIDPKTICKEISLNLTQSFCYAAAGHLSNSKKRGCTILSALGKCRMVLENRYDWP